MEPTFHLQGWGFLCLWNNSLRWPMGHNSAEKRGRSRYWSCLAVAHNSFWLMHHHVFLHWLVTQKHIKSPARWAAPPLLRLGCKRGCLCQICAVLDLCELMCHHFIADLFGNNSAAASPSPVLLGAKQLSVVLNRFECSSFVALCLRTRWVTGRLHALFSWVWIRGKGSGITGDCLPEHLTKSCISQGWRLLWPPGPLGPALRGMSSSVLLCQLGEKPVRSAWPVKL